MKAIWFIFVTLAAGLIGGLSFGAVNIAVAEPLVDKAIGFEVQNELNAGHMVNYAMLKDYRQWQKEGEIVSAVILGMAFASILGIVFAYSRKALPGRSNVKKAVVLSGIMWFTLFFVTSLKYPANPPAVDSPGNTIYYRQGLYVVFLAISALAALCAAFAAKRYGERIKPVLLVPIIYAPVVIAAYFAMPDNGYQVPELMKGLVLEFRMVSGLVMAMFWAVMGITFGLLWDRFRPQLETNQTLRSV